MNAITSLYSRIVGLLSGSLFESLGLLFARVALAGIFWRSYQTKVEDGSWFSINETTLYQFQNDWSGVPLPPELAAPMATYAEFTFPLLLFVGLFTRFAAVSLIAMTMVIQIFVLPTWPTWWITHIVWVALALPLVSRGGGMFALDRLFDRAIAPKAD